MYSYRCTIESVVDADTLDLGIDLGFSVTVSERVRLANINAVEKRTEKGPKSIEFVAGWLKGRSLLVSTYKDRNYKDRQEKFGRYLGIISDAATGEVLNDRLVQEGYAVPFMVIK